MELLPAEISLPEAPFKRRHRPKVAGGRTGYRAYRACLRWDFGFICPFCLLRESDFSPSGGAEGTGLMTVEHRIPQSRDPSLRNTYPNCYYACRFCNISRSNYPTLKPSGERLLDPTVDSWNRHFEWQGTRLRPKEGDASAAYTHDAYDIDDPRKRTIRQFRLELYADRLRIVKEAPAKIDRLLELADRCREEDPERSDELIEAAHLLHIAQRNALAELSRYAAIPSDAPGSCNCRSLRHHSLPEALQKQLIPV